MIDYLTRGLRPTAGANIEGALDGAGNHGRRAKQEDAASCLALFVSAGVCHPMSMGDRGSVWEPGVGHWLLNAIIRRCTVKWPDSPKVRETHHCSLRLRGYQIDRRALVTLSCGGVWRLVIAYRSPRVLRHPQAVCRRLGDLSGRLPGRSRTG